MSMTIDRGRAPCDDRLEPRTEGQPIPSTRPHTDELRVTGYRMRRGKSIGARAHRKRIGVAYNTRVRLKGRSNQSNDIVGPDEK